jgi:hypothetical protein
MGLRAVSASPVLTTSISASGNITSLGKITANNYDCSGSTAPVNGWTVPAANTVSLYTNSAVGLTIGPTKSVIIGNAALATAATDGFLYITTVASAPTGTPTAVTGRVALVYDTASDKFWIYNGSWKTAKTPSAAALVTWQ